MTDRQQTELAAKAAGVTGAWDSHAQVFVPTHGKLTWSPLPDDGDALRLAVTLHLGVLAENESSVAWDLNVREEVVGNDPYAATRRAIVRAAAKIGKEMK